MNKIIIKIILLLYLISIIPIINVFADSTETEYFREDFNDSILNNSKWAYDENGGLINLQNGKIKLSSSNTRTFPYIRTKTNPFPPTGGFSFNVNLQYLNLSPFGDGVVLSNLLPPNNASENYMDVNLDSINLFTIWQDYNSSGLSIYYTSCPLNQNCEHRKFIYRIQGYQLSNHDIKILYQNLEYILQVDGEEVYRSVKTSRRPNSLFIGNPVTLQTPQNWTSFQSDFILINKLSSNQNVIPIVLIPGMFASWNSDALLHGAVVNQNRWERAKFVPDYDGLAKTITDAGYDSDKNSPDQNFFMFDYDWRKPLDKSADDLDFYIRGTILSKHPDSKIKIVGHSLGGLLGRAYLQKYGDTSVDQLVTVGSPHYGSAESYYPWEGGVPPPGDTSSRIALGLYLRANKLRNETDKDTIQRTIPSIRDILPTFDFLINDQTNQIIHFPSMKEKNTWMPTIQPTFPQYFPLFDAIVGHAGNTEEWFHIKSPSASEKALNIWPDGKPVKTEFTGFGDEVVLINSASFTNDSYSSVPVNHGGLVKDILGIDKITSVLGIQTNQITQGKGAGLPSLIFALQSAASMQISGPGVNESANDLLFIPGVSDGNYILTVTGNTQGNYHLISGFINENLDQWFEFDSKTNGGKIDTYQFSVNPQAQQPFQITDLTGEIFLRSAREKLLYLKNIYSHKSLTNALLALDGALSDLKGKLYSQAISHIYQTIAEIFSYRDASSLRVPEIHQRTAGALGDLADAFVIISTNNRRAPLVNITQLNLAKGAIESVESKLQGKLSKGQNIHNQSLAITQAKDLYTQAEQAFANGEKFKAEILLFDINLYIAEANR